MLWHCSQSVTVCIYWLPWLIVLTLFLCCSFNVRTSKENDTMTFFFYLYKITNCNIVMYCKMNKIICLTWPKRADQLCPAHGNFSKQLASWKTLTLINGLLLVLAINGNYHSGLCHSFITESLSRNRVSVVMCDDSSWPSWCWKSRLHAL